MSHHNLVSESAVSLLNIELITYVVSRHLSNEENNSEVGELEAMRDLESLGLLLGFRLSERLLYREFSLGEFTPLEVARYVGHQVWKSLFGKKVDRMKHMDNIYFCLIDTDFCWLKGFAKLQEVDSIDSTTVVNPPGYPEEAATTSQPGAYINRTVDSMIHHKDVLVYAVGVLKGTVQGMFSNNCVKIYGVLHKDHEAHFVLDFRPQVT